MGIILFLAVHFLLLASANGRTFPSDFLFGVGTSAYQTEGAWNEDGKSENIWDHWIHEDVSRIANNDTADVACDSYHWYLLDILSAKQLNVSHYQFSISWSRILPNGNEINVKGILYYKAVIARILENGMIPVATLYHNDLPQALQDIGGWTNPEMVTYFAKYARTAFQYFDGVGYWLTFNGPRSTCRLGYGEGTCAPGIALDGIGDYMCAYVVVKAHAAAYRLYKSEFPHLTAKMSIAIDFDWSEPSSDETPDVEAAERRNLFEFGLYANPIYKGNWPQTVIDRVRQRSNNENLPRSRLPEFTQEEIDFINGTFDFMGVNIFTTHRVADIDEPEYGDPGFMEDMKAVVYRDPSWDVSSDGKPIVPWGATKSLRWLKTTYNNPEIFITGNGVADSDRDLQDDPSTDTDRMVYIVRYLDAILDAMDYDEVNVFGYTAWSLLDGFDWTQGYSHGYGFFSVNHTNPLSRSSKLSTLVYGKITSSHELPGEDSTTTTTPSTTTTGSADNIPVAPLVVLTVATGFYCLFF